MVGEENVIDASILLSAELQQLVVAKPEIRLDVFDPKAGAEGIFPIEIPGEDPTEVIHEEPVTIPGSTESLANEAVQGSPVERPTSPTPAFASRKKANAPVFKPLMALTSDEVDFLEAILKHFSHYNEIWVSPALKKMREEFYLWSEYQRSQTLNELDRKGALAIYVRPGDNGIEYNVAKINWNHPAVQRCNPG